MRPFIFPAVAAACALGVLALAPHPGEAGGKGTGAIEGVVTFEGKPPAPTKIPATQDPYCAKKKIVDETVVVRGGKLRDVHVGLPSGSAGSHPTPKGKVEVDQSGCMYRPRVVGVVNDQKVAIKNSDHTFHNVRGTHGDKHAFNHGQPQKFPPIEEKAGKPGQTLTLRCDIHPWMRGYAVVTDHPFFDVSGADGAFRIDDVPAGTYQLRAWHPEMGEKTAKVTVKKGKTATVRFTFP